MSCHRAAWPAGGVRPTWVLRSRGPLRPPGASRASARRGVITRPTPGMPQIVARVVVMVSPWRSAPVFSAVPVTRGRHFIAELWTVMTAGWTRTPRRDIGRITEIGYGSFRASPDS